MARSRKAGRAAATGGAGRGRKASTSGRGKKTTATKGSSSNS